MTTNNTESNKIVGSKVKIVPVAETFREEVKTKLNYLKSNGIDAPLLVGILANNDPSAVKYSEWTRKTLESDGFRYELRTISDPIDVERELTKANDDPNVHGIIVYYPIFGQVESFSGASQDDYLRDSISHTKDVEGLCHSYRTNLYRNVRYLDYPTNTKKCLLPCTALSVVKILESLCYDTSLPAGRKMSGKTVTIINRSEIVGRPLAAMLANDGAEVYSIDINSIYLFRDGRLHTCNSDTTVEECVKRSQVVITGVPTEKYKLPTQWIQEGTVIVNVSSFKNVNVDDILQIPNVRYVHQVGKVTVAMLERNLMRLFENFHHPDRVHDHDDGIALRKEEKKWYGNPIQLYTALAVTTLLFVQFTRRN